MHLRAFTTAFVVLAIIVAILGIVRAQQFEQQSDDGPLIGIHEFNDQPWLRYRQGTRDYSIRIDSVIAVSESTDAEQTYWHLPGTTLRVDVSLEEFDAIWNEYQEQNDGNDNN